MALSRLRRSSRGHSCLLAGKTCLRCARAAFTAWTPRVIFRGPARGWPMASRFSHRCCTRNARPWPRRPAQSAIFWTGETSMYVAPSRHLTGVSIGRSLLASLLFICLAAATMAQAPAPADYDLIIQNGRIVDGSGNPWYVADVGIREGRIAAIGRLCGSGNAGCPAKRALDAHGLVVAPGFIDVHTHVEESIRRTPTADNFLFDGVTSLITGNCGGSETELAKFFDEMRQSGISINVGTLVGHNSV